MTPGVRKLIVLVPLLYHITLALLALPSSLTHAYPYNYFASKRWPRGHRLFYCSMPALNTVLMVLVFYYKGICRKGINAKTPAILRFFFVTERTRLNAAHALLVIKLRLNAE